MAAVQTIDAGKRLSFVRKWNLRALGNLRRPQPIHETRHHLFLVSSMVNGSVQFPHLMFHLVVAPAPYAGPGLILLGELVNPVLYGVSLVFPQHEFTPGQTYLVAHAPGVGSPPVHEI